MPHDRTVTLEAPFDQVQQNVRQALTGLGAMAPVAEEAARRLDAALTSLVGADA
ncbi:hypothetical protein [Streptomyces sp. sk2.1]|uniref:hypothetical protein n=1 Tax=Streptomyces sp. sk2.1 TaxID=2478959 RepID=UPI0016531D70|nr:hypothetical protein [Streptomyces sp. sk2.1]